MRKYIIILSIATFLFNHAYSQDGALIGEIRVFGLNFPPVGWQYCNGATLNAGSYSDLFLAIGYTYGGSGSSFSVPNLNGRVAVGSGQGDGLSNYPLGSMGGSSTITYSSSNLPSHSHLATLNTENNAANTDTPEGSYPASSSENIYSSSSNTNMGEGSIVVTTESAGNASPSAQNNIQPSLGVNYCICTSAVAGSPFYGEIRLLAGNTIPNGWSVCDGSIISIASNNILFSLLGTMYGGDGMTTFAIPDLRGRVPVSIGMASGGSTNYTHGMQGGLETNTLSVDQMAAHSHSATAKIQVHDGIGDSDTPENNYPAINPKRGKEYTTTSGSTAGNISVQVNNAGSTASVSNIQPYTAVQYIIYTAASGGIYPPRN